MVASALRSPVREIATSRRFMGRVNRCDSSWSIGIDHASGACPAAYSPWSRTSTKTSSASSPPTAICGIRWPT
jgi:hypothetical protein